MFCTRRHHTLFLLLVVFSLSLPLLLAAPALAGEGAWTPLGPEGGWVLSFAFDPVNPATMYAGVREGGLYKSTDGGAHWAALSVTLGSADVFAIVVDPTNPAILYVATSSMADGHNGIYKSSDGGVTWTASNNGLPSNGFFNIDLAMDPTVPSTLYTFGSNALFKSTNGGLSWSASSASLPANFHVSGLAINPITPTILYTGLDGYGVYKSTDGGAHWAASNSGLPSLKVQDLAIDPATPTTLYVGTQDRGIFKSTNGGVSWSESNTGLPGLKVISLAVSQANPAVVYAGVENWGMACSTNRGATWSLCRTGLTDPYVWAVTVHPLDPATVYAGTMGEGIFKSTTGGAAWSASNNGLKAHLVSSLAVSPGSPPVLHAGTDSGGIWRSGDGGATWNGGAAGFTTWSITALQAHPTDPSILYAGAAGNVFPFSRIGGGVWRSVDGGATWQQRITGLANLNVNTLALDPAAPATLYAGTNGGVFKSSNEGQSWTSTGLPDTNVNALAIDPASPATLYAGTGQGIFKSENGGASWADGSTGLGSLSVQVLAIDPAAPATLFAGAGFNGLFKSVNGGASWAAVTSLPGTSIVALLFDPAMPHVLYAGLYNNGGIWRSGDGGETWATYNGPDLTNMRLMSLALSPGPPATLYAGTEGGGIFALTPTNPIVSLVKRVDNPQPEPGQLITYTITLSSSLGAGLTGVVVSDTLPAGLSLAGPVTLSPPQPGAVLAGTPAALPILASHLSLSGGQALTLTVPVRVDAGVLVDTVLTNTAVATDTAGLLAMASQSTVTVTVTDLNQAPVLDPIPEQTIAAGSLLTFTASATDSDLPAQTLTYSLTDAPAGAVLNPTTGVFHWTPGEAQAGQTYTFTLTVTDDGSPNLSASQIVTIGVVLPPVAGFTAAPPSGPQPLVVSFSNSSTRANAYLWDFGDSYTSTLVSPMHRYDQPRVYTVTLTAFNAGASHTLTRTGYITVTRSTLPVYVPAIRK